MDSKQQRIGVIGTGAIGGFYGLMLAHAGHDVHFLLRSEFEAVNRAGLSLNSAVHGFRRLAPVQAYHSAQDMPPCDWLLVGAKTTGNDELAPLIRAAAAPGAKVLLLQNGLGVEERLRPLLPESLHLLGGLCFICVHRGEPGVIEHQAYGGVNLGYHSGPADERRRREIVEEPSGCPTIGRACTTTSPMGGHWSWRRSMPRPWPALLLRATGCPGSRRCTRRCASSKRNRAEGPSAATSRRRARREKRDLPQRAGKSPKQQGTLGEWMLAANLLMRPAAQAVEEAA